MKQSVISRATLGRLPLYLEYIEMTEQTKLHVSAAEVAKALNLGEVQVRKDLCTITGGGKPRVGFLKASLIRDIKATLGYDRHSEAIIIGAGKLGQALLGFDGFEEFGIDIVAAIDADPSKVGTLPSGKRILHISDMPSFISENNVRIGIITVPAQYAQEACNNLVVCGIKAIWNFAPTHLSIPDDVVLKNENLALSLAHLNVKAE